MSNETDTPDDGEPIAEKLLNALSRAAANVDGIDLTVGSYRVKTERRSVGFFGWTEQVLVVYDGEGNVAFKYKL